MPGFDVLIAFVIATAVFAYMPGPAMLYATAQTLARGRKAGWMAALGIHLGGYAHVAAASLGLAVLFQAIPPLYLTLKIAGAAYLIWLGFKLLRSRQSLSALNLTVEAKSAKRAFWESVTVEVLNPKTAIFFVAFLPQFTDPSASLPIWAQLMVLGTAVNVIFSSADVACVLLAARLSGALQRSQKAGQRMQRLGGGILIALGLNIALQRS